MPPRRLHVWEGSASEAWRRAWGVPRLRVYRTIRSTSTLAFRLAERGAPHGTTVIAEQQSAGRGRRGSAWLDAAGNSLLMSVVLRAARPGVAAGGPASIRVGLIVARAIERSAGIAPTLKWPNDVLAADGRKLAGILCEGTLGAGGFLVVGIGVNVLQSGDAFPAALRRTATSVAAAGGRPVARAALAGATLHALLDVPDITAPLSAAELDAIGQRDALRGVPLTVDGAAAGIGDGVAADGALRLRGQAGSRLLYNGTVRPAAAGAGGRPGHDAFVSTTHHG